VVLVIDLVYMSLLQIGLCAEMAGDNAVCLSVRNGFNYYPIVFNLRHSSHDEIRSAVPRN
jgi:hypothetical protein